MALLTRIREWIVQDAWFKDPVLMQIQTMDFHMHIAEASALTKERHATSFTVNEGTAKGFLGSDTITIGQVRKLLGYLGLSAPPGMSKGGLLEKELFGLLAAGADASTSGTVSRIPLSLGLLLS